MRVFKIENSSLSSYREEDFKSDNVEKILEDWIENSPCAIFEDEEVLIIGRQVTTNLGKAIDLLGLDKKGNTVVIELKREKTPRETVAQILEYASYVEDLTYEQLEEIAGNYTGDEGLNLAENHRTKFRLSVEEAVAFNKEQRLVIVGQDISKEIENTSVFLNKKGLEIYCIAFKYFKDNAGERIVTSDFVVKKDKNQEVSTESKPKINQKIFLENVDEYIRDFFIRLFNLAEENNMPVRWGSTGFSLNVDLSGNYVSILYGYCNIMVDGQSFYTATAKGIRKKVNNSGAIIDKYFKRLSDTGLFIPAGNDIRWVIDKPVSEEVIKSIFDAVLFVKSEIEDAGALE